MFNQLLRYGVAAVFGYLIIIFGNIFIIEFFHVNARLSYLFVISFAYFSNYILNTKFVFKVDFNKKNMAKYIFFLFIFWLLNNAVFGLMVDYLKIYYIFAILFNFLTIGPVRFFIQKKYVFTKVS